MTTLITPSQLAAFRILFESPILPVIDAIVPEIMALDSRTHAYLTGSGFWLGFQLEPKRPHDRGRPFVQLVTPHKRKYGNYTLRIFITKPTPASPYADPERLIDLSGSDQPHFEIARVGDIPKAMALIEQSYKYKRQKYPFHGVESRAV